MTPPFLRSPSSRLILMVVWCVVLAVSSSKIRGFDAMVADKHHHGESTTHLSRQEATVMANAQPTTALQQSHAQRHLVVQPGSPTIVKNVTKDSTWSVQKSGTSTSVVSAEGLFHLTMNFSAAAMDGMGYKITLFQSDCTGPPLSEPLASNIVLTVEDGPDRDGLKNVQASFDISKSALENNAEVWVQKPGSKLGTADICTRLELMSDDSNSATAISMDFLEVLMELTVDFTRGFAMSNIVTTASDRAAQDDLTSDALARNNTINACHCDASSGTCYGKDDAAPELNQGDILNICLTLPDDVELSSISDLTLKQDTMRIAPKTLGFIFYAISSGVQNYDTVVINPDGGQSVVIQVIMVSPFYLTQSVPQAVKVEGKAILKLASTEQRRVLIVKDALHHAATTKSNKITSNRALTRRKQRTQGQQGEEGAGSSSFVVEVKLAQMHAVGSSSAASAVGSSSAASALSNNSSFMIVLPAMLAGIVWMAADGIVSGF
jgi:hypothetical protein